MIWQEVENKKHDVRAKRNQYRRYFRKQFIKHILASGELNCVLASKEKQGAKVGKLPQHFNIHHIVPLSLGSDNTFDNLCVIDVDLHNKMNETIIDPQTHSNCPTVFMPVLPKVVTNSNSRELIERMKGRSR